MFAKTLWAKSNNFLFNKNSDDNNLIAAKFQVHEIIKVVLDNFKYI